MSGRGSLRIALWNSEWSSPRGSRGGATRRWLAEAAADVACLTEGAPGLFPPDGEVIHPDGHAVGPRADDRRILLWSRAGWTDVDRVGHPELPHDGFVSGVTETPLGEVTIVGVCIPWHMAGVLHGAKDRRPWQEHLRYLEGLAEILAARDRARPTIVVGDFNQRIPHSWSPVHVYDALVRTFACFELATAGHLDQDRPERGVDHLAHDASLRSSSVRAEPGHEPAHDRISLTLDLA